MMDPDVEKLDDIRQIKLSELKIITDNLISKYGDNAILIFDSGYNNICVTLQQE